MLFSEQPQFERLLGTSTSLHAKLPQVLGRSSRRQMRLLD